MNENLLCLLPSQNEYIQSLQIRLGNVLRSHHRTFARHIVLFHTRTLAFKYYRRLAIEAVTLELHCRHSIVVQEVELLDRKALHLRNDEEDPSNCDERECRPYETLQSKSAAENQSHRNLELTILPPRLP
jgi:hypothetical protein